MKATLTAAALALALAAPALVQAADKTPVARADRADSDTHEKSSMVDDTLITTKVKSALLAEKGIDSGKISVETEKGKVMLSGDVKSPDQRQRAEGIARKVTGVKEVDNKLEVK
ncbi:MAG TPA: BON domain-containing protein [Burkholderiales bacterium]|jgi:osmotically-inducible protein OsmY|nr:BON domain-containing protein [Burkholderiales bacterium]